MKIDGGIGGLRNAGEMARQQEDLGYDGLWSAETGHDPFLPLAVAATATERVELGTSITVAFARNPMTMAMVANDLQLASQGRFLLGLGSQIQPHIEKRFSMPWSKPAARMREFIEAMHAIWKSWNDGEKLEFRGDFYTHTLMTPFFNPGRNEYGPPKVYIAAVGPLMTRVVGEVCDGLLVHPFSTERYLREETMPALEEGLKKAGRSRSDVEVTAPSFVVTGADEAEYNRAAAGVRQQVAFYGSTPAYRPVLETHGWGDLQGELNMLSKQGKWTEMGQLIDDEILDAFAVCGEPDEIPTKLAKRYGDVCDRVSFNLGRYQDSDRIAEARKILAG
jgi:probable F420-dependent oxidoreductase